MRMGEVKWRLPHPAAFTRNGDHMADRSLKITEFLEESMVLLKQLDNSAILRAEQILLRCYHRHGRVYTFGNGGPTPATRDRTPLHSPHFPSPRGKPKRSMKDFLARRISASLVRLLETSKSPLFPPAAIMSPTSCTEVEKLLLISSLQSLDSIRDERRGGDSGVVIRGGRGTARLQKTNLPAVEKSETTKELRCSHDGQ